MIVDERIITFINSMDTENSEILETIEQEALATDVPIIRREMQSFLEVLLLMKKRFLSRRRLRTFFHQ